MNSAEQARGPLQWTRKATQSSGIWFVALGAALWGVDPLFRILLLERFTSTQIVFLEHVLLALFAIPVLWMHRRSLGALKSWSIVGALLFISWGGSALATVLFTAAFAEGSANAVLLLQKLQPLFAIILARVWLREALPSRFGLYILLALAGTYLLTFGFHTPMVGWQELGTLGCLFSIGAAALWGGSTVMGKKLLDQGLSFPVVTSLRFLLALPLLAGLMSYHGDPWRLGSADSGLSMTAAVINLILQAVLPGLLSLLLYYRGLSGTPASYATLAELSFPAVGILVNWLVLQQPVTAGQLIGFLLIWSTLWHMSRTSSQTSGREPLGAAA